MNKPLIVFVTIADWANSTYEAVQAINCTGDIDVRHITFWRHPWCYPTDICVDIAGKGIVYDDEAKQNLKIAHELLEAADAVHMWNCEFQDMYNQGTHGFTFVHPFKAFPIHKVKSCTWAGSSYRRNHKMINERMAGTGIHCCVEDPTFHWRGEQTEFIPHAVNTAGLLPREYEDRDAMAIGCYNPGRDYYNRDIALLKSAIDAHANGCHLVMDRLPIDWRSHVEEVSKCWWYFQSMDEELGTFGRSALEASAMGIPTMSYVCDKAKAQERGGFDDLGVIEVTPNTLYDQLHKLATGELGKYQELATKARRWVVSNYSYEVVGQQYTDMLKEHAL